MVSPPSIQPPPLFVPPSRARRRFAERLAERQRALQGNDDDDIDVSDLADATDEIDLDDIEEHQPVSLHSEPLDLDEDEYLDRHPEDHTSAWHDNERVTPIDEDDDVGLVIGGGLGGGSGDGTPEGNSPPRRKSVGLEMASNGGGKGPGRFNRLFAGDNSDSD